MLLFKTAGDTINGVLFHQKHAFYSRPKDYYQGEIALISKNRKDCRKEEKQIQHIMYLNDMRFSNHEEIERYWPNNFGRWRFIADCYDMTILKTPFNLDDIIDYNQLRPYKNMTPAQKILPVYEQIILDYLKNINAVD